MEDSRPKREVIRTVEMHTGGEPLRIIQSGVLLLDIHARMACVRHTPVYFLAVLEYRSGWQAMRFMPAKPNMRRLLSPLGKV